MPLPDTLLNPISGENPSGEDLRYAPLYDQIKEARRQEEEFEQGEWKTEIKKADYPLVIKLASEAIASKSKDLQLAAWLTDALLRTEGFAGLKQGLDLLHGLVGTFWDSLYPQLEDGDAELRAGPLDWVGSNLVLPLRMAPLNKAKHGWLDYTESRKIVYEEQADTDEKKEARKNALEAKKVLPEDFDKSFSETPKAFYVSAEATLDGCTTSLQALDALCREKFGDVAPSFTELKKGLETVRHSVHLLLQKKRETEPDPVETAAEPGAAESAGAEGAAPGGVGRSAAAVVGIVIPLADKEPAARRDMIASVSRAAAALRKLDPYSPAPYLMMRGLRWGELRAAFHSSDMTLLEGPPTVLRQHIKKLAIEGKWEELLEAAENAMSLPCSRGWLDMQRFVVDACVGLGSKYEAIAVAIRSELKALLRDLPQVLETTLLDDTPAANSETQAWLKELLAEPSTPTSEAAPTEGPVLEDHSAPGWHRKFVDSYDLARQALREGQPEKALDLMRREVERQLSGRGKFLRKLQLVDVCIAAGKSQVAQPIIDDLAADIENNHLEDWEDREIVARALAMILKNSQRVQADESEKLRLFQKVVRLDPVQAISCLET
jgi:type VI secretion system protein ImpA